MDWIHYAFINTLSLNGWVWRGRSGTMVGGPPGAYVRFYLREAFQTQTNTEKILYNKSR